MRINQYLARHTSHSRRSADVAIQQGRVKINNILAKPGDIVALSDIVHLDSSMVTPSSRLSLIILNKPTGFVVSRQGQGSRTIYDLLPPSLSHLNPVGRLDKDSSGLLLMTNDGDLAHKLTHPSFNKQKIYQVELDRPLKDSDRVQLEKGIVVEGTYLSRLKLNPLLDQTNSWNVTLSEGRNRQIRRTFSELNYKVIRLHRTHFGPYALGKLTTGKYREQS